jgi:hypothetical protein
MMPCVASQRVIPKVSVYFFMDSVRKLLGTPSYVFRFAFEASECNQTFFDSGYRATSTKLPLSIG